MKYRNQLLVLIRNSKMWKDINVKLIGELKTSEYWK